MAEAFAGVDVFVNSYYVRFNYGGLTFFGDGSYRAQPITVEAFADVALEAIGGDHRTATLAVAGPSDWRFLDMVRAVRRAVGSRALIVRAPAWVALAGLTVAGVLL